MRGGPVTSVVRRVALSLAGGGCLWAAFPSVGAWPLAPVGVGLIALATRGTSARFGAVLGLLAGWAFFLPTLTWSGSYLGDLPWIALSTLQAGYWALLGAASAFLQGQVSLAGIGRIRPFVIALLWVAQEWLRGTTPYGGFPWVRLAYSQADSPLGRLAAWGGPPAVTFAVALVGAVLASAASAAWRERTWRSVAAPVLVAVSVSVMGYAVPVATDGPTADVVAVQGNVPRAGLDFNAERRAVLDNHARGTTTEAARRSAAAELPPDLVVWPENSSDIDPARNADALAVIDNAVNAIRAPIIVGTFASTATDIYNVSLLFQPGRATPVAGYAKRHPVPFAEYIPNRAFWRVFSDQVDLLAHDLSAGETPGVFRVPRRGGGEVAAGILICFEVAYDSLVQDVVAAGANVLVVQTNNATFGYTAESEQQLAISRIRAIETGRTVVHISTVGVSALIWPDGTLRSPTSLFTHAVLTGAVPVRTATTVARALGSWPERSALLVSGAILLAAGWTSRRTRHTEPDIAPTAP